MSKRAALTLAGVVLGAGQVLEAAPIRTHGEEEKPRKLQLVVPALIYPGLAGADIWSTQRAKAAGAEEGNLWMTEGLVGKKAAQALVLVGVDLVLQRLHQGKGRGWVVWAWRALVVGAHGWIVKRNLDVEREAKEWNRKWKEAQGL